MTQTPNTPAFIRSTDCVIGAHRACNGDAFSISLGHWTDCECVCHSGKALVASLAETFKDVTYGDPQTVSEVFGE